MCSFVALGIALPYVNVVPTRLRSSFQQILLAHPALDRGSGIARTVEATRPHEGGSFLVGQSN
jgi:hypothetical protein